MFETKVGPLADDSAVAYLRPETAQGIFANYKNIVDTGRVKIPFGIAQIGKPSETKSHQETLFFALENLSKWKLNISLHLMPTGNHFTESGSTTCIDWLVSIGIPRDGISEDIHPKDKLAFYSQATTDLMFEFPHGKQELWGDCLPK